MSTPNYERLQKVELSAPNAPPPPYDGALSLSPGLTPAGAYGAPPSFPPYYSPPAAGPSQGPIIVQQSQTVFVTFDQPVQVPDFLGFSIFTTLCCCLPLGIAALVYSVQTRYANLAGNITAAKQHSRIACILNNAALGLGLVFLTATTVCSIMFL